MDQIEVDIEPYALESGDRLLLCSDGLWSMVREPEAIVEIIESATDLEAAVHALVDAANRAGGEDNIAVGLLRTVVVPDIPT
jgi:protein phosphatase